MYVMLSLYFKGQANRAGTLYILYQGQNQQYVEF